MGQSSPVQVEVPAGATPVQAGSCLHEDMHLQADRRQSPRAGRAAARAETLRSPHQGVRRRVPPPRAVGARAAGWRRASALCERNPRPPARPHGERTCGLPADMRQQSRAQSRTAVRRHGVHHRSDGCRHSRARGRSWGSLSGSWSLCALVQGKGSHPLGGQADRASGQVADSTPDPARDWPLPA